VAAVLVAAVAAVDFTAVAGRSVVERSVVERSVVEPVLRGVVSVAEVVRDWGAVRALLVVDLAAVLRGPLWEVLRRLIMD
jgi:hypothetical protein